MRQCVSRIAHLPYHLVLGVFGNLAVSILLFFNRFLAEYTEVDIRLICKLVELTFVQTYIDRVVTYPYHIEIVLDVGFGITDELKETITIRRGDLYALFESRTED